MSEVAAKVDDLRLQQDAEEGRKRFSEQKKAQEQWIALPLGHPLKAPSQEEIADYWGVRYEDCDKDASSWSDG